MSRSRKKHGVVKDRGGIRTYNRAFRRINRQRITCGMEPLLMDEVINQYDVCDYRFRWNEKWWRSYFDNPRIQYRWYKTIEDAKRSYFKK